MLNLLVLCTIYVYVDGWLDFLWIWLANLNDLYTCWAAVAKNDQFVSLVFHNAQLTDNVYRILCTWIILCTEIYLNMNTIAKTDSMGHRKQQQHQQQYI